MDLVTAMTVFNRVADFSSFSAAARTLHMSKTAVSRYVSELEASVGARLLNRTTRTMHLTEVGEAYYRRSAAVLDEIEELQASARIRHVEPGGKLRITTPTTFGHCRIMPLIPRFVAEHPKIDMEICIANRAVDLIEEGFDVAIRMGKLADSSLVCRKLCSTKMHVCASSAFLKTHGAPKRPEDLERFPCVVFPGFERGNRWSFESKSGKVSVPVLGRVVVDSNEAIAMAVRSGVGIGLLPDFVVGEDLNTGQLHQLLDGYEVPGANIYVVYPHKKHLPAKVRVFVDFLSIELGRID